MASKTHTPERKPFDLVPDPRTPPLGTCRGPLEGHPLAPEVHGFHPPAALQPRSGLPVSAFIGPPGWPAVGVGRQALANHGCCAHGIVALGHRAKIWRRAVSSRTGQITRDDFLGKRADQHWVYKVRKEIVEHSSAFGEWGEFFDEWKEDEWGGTWVTRSNESLRFLREEIEPGDRIWAYQVSSRRPGETKRIIGLTEVVEQRPSQRLTADGEQATDLILRPLLRFQPPIAIHDEKKRIATLNAASAFSPGWGGTIYRLSRQEAEALTHLCLPHAARP
jgi:hypothetical protein